MKVQNVIEIQVKNRKMDVKHQKITDRFNDPKKDA